MQPAARRISGRRKHSPAARSQRHCEHCSYTLLHRFEHTSIQKQDNVPENWLKSILWTAAKAILHPSFIHWSRIWDCEPSSKRVKALCSSMAAGRLLRVGSCSRLCLFLNVVVQRLYVTTALRNYVLVSYELTFHLDTDFGRHCPHLDIELA